MRSHPDTTPARAGVAFVFASGLARASSTPGGAVRAGGGGRCARVPGAVGERSEGSGREALGGADPVRCAGHRATSELTDGGYAAFKEDM